LVQHLDWWRAAWPLIRMLYALITELEVHYTRLDGAELTLP